jgi:hypothetical protein
MEERTVHESALVSLSNFSKEELQMRHHGVVSNAITCYLEEIEDDWKGSTEKRHKDTDNFLSLYKS